MIGHGVSSRSSHSAAAGRTTCSAKPCTQSRMSRWSCVRSSENEVAVAASMPAMLRRAGACVVSAGSVDPAVALEAAIAVDRRPPGGGRPAAASPRSAAPRRPRRRPARSCRWRRRSPSTSLPSTIAMIAAAAIARPTIMAIVLAPQCIGALSSRISARAREQQPRPAVALDAEERAAGHVAVRRVHGEVGRAHQQPEDAAGQQHGADDPDRPLGQRDALSALHFPAPFGYLPSSRIRARL